MSGTVTLHRVLAAPASRIYKAFLDPDAMAKWLPPHGFTGKVHEMDARVGGRYRMSFTNFGDGNGARVLSALGSRVPDFVAQLPKLAPELRLLQHAQVGKRQVYSYCFCSVR